MSWQVFHQTALGGSHQRSGLPCQDSAVSEEYKGARILIVADGHGSRKHFRSERGSSFACQAALEEIKALTPELEGPPDEDQLAGLKERILARWLEMVAEDVEREPWTPEELDEAEARGISEELERLKSGGAPYIPYGSTLVAAFAGDSYWAGVQLGDGILVTIGREGEYVWPMPESNVNIGNRTASLCMGNPMPEFRHCVGTEDLAGLVVCTDGVEKAFPPAGEKVASYLHWLWLAAREEPGEAQGLLESYARRVAQRSGIKDDVGIAVMADPDARDVPPQPTRQQKDRELHQAAAQLEELKTVIDYTARQLECAGSDQERQQLRQILERRMAEQAAFEARLEDAGRESGDPWDSRGGSE